MLFKSWYGQNVIKYFLVVFIQYIINVGKQCDVEYFEVFDQG